MTYGGNSLELDINYATTRDGRESYFALRRHYFGNSYQAQIRAAADKTVEKDIYDARACNFTFFENYFAKINTAFEDVEESGVPVAMAKEARKLLNAIPDANLEHAKSQVMTTAHLCDDFKSAVDL
eukprot:CAMPEP_0118674714 /NCGR_PEP_ID=MMETSP0800-20121206/1040_1 /TAXON_ID=210618 ORGANISM="Striatella unipunctata, Strain CCMP2910" /NCGR_SAMPLE_ID=MMETSP0800 /ASSEMBLY_ACC=CAM_ASM_000638 /LENGTH=125 /DNA_ID=CAMNT_0006569937 /DNA_START=1037 /DNA_END=1416 /DNA_ORIENTATION=-